MRASTRTLRRALSPVLATLMLAASVAGPVLDRGQSGFTPVLESEHAPGQCVVGHDHKVCTQLGAARALPGAEARLPEPSLPILRLAGTPRASFQVALADTGHSPRAPPFAAA